MADEEQTDSENDPVVEENVQDAPAQTDPAPEPQKEASFHEHRNQWIFFGILVGILIGTVLVIALLRPLIFDRIVPAVMGDFNTPVPATVDETVPTENQPAPEDTVPVEENNEATESSAEGSNEVFIPAAASGEDTADTTSVEETVAEEPQPEPVTHTVQVGDNLTKISAQYDVPVAEIMAVNSLTNADYISVGQVLVIPTN